MSANPTGSELAILKVLWKRGPSTVREVHGELGATTAYTTALKTMQVMVGKGLLTRDESERSHTYAPAVQEGATEAGLVNDLVERAFEGSAAKLAMRALSVGKASRAELDEVRALLDALEKKS